MKKKFIGIDIICAMAIAAVFTVNMNKDEEAMLDVLLANVDALAQNESIEFDRPCLSQPFMKCIYSWGVLDGKFIY